MNMNKKAVLLFLALWFCLLSACGPATSEAETPSQAPTPTPTLAPENHVISFADPIVEAETRRLLDKPTGDITEADLLTVTEFGIWSTEMIDGPISTLADFRWFQNLEYLNLSWRELSSLEGIETLSRLRTLILRDNDITDLTPVRGLTGLTSLTTACNPVSDYTPLKGLTQLESLNIGENGNTYTDLSFCSGMTGLTSLRAVWCGVSDISVLAAMPDLEYLNLHHNNISDISVLSDLTELNYLALDLNPVTDIRPLFGLTKLTSIYLDRENIPEADWEEFCTPKEGDYFTDTHYGQLHDSLPQFRFDTRMYFNKRTNGYAADTLTVTDCSTGEVIQTVSIPELTCFGNTCISIYDEDKGFSLEDVNFDGYLDLRLLDTYNGNYRVEYIYLVWDPDRSCFVHDPRLSAIPMASFDQEKQLIYGMERGGAAYHCYYTYQYIDGVPTLIDVQEEYATQG